MLDSRTSFLAAAGGLLLLVAHPARADDGSRLWLRYDPVEQPLRQRYASEATEIVVHARGAAVKTAASELERGLSGLVSSPIPVRPNVDRNGAVLLTFAHSAEIRQLHLLTRHLGDEGFLVQSARVHAHRVTLIVANSERGLLYGAFTLLRTIETHRPLDHLALRERPALALRMLDHWDNLDRTVERGYAGMSLWDWASLPNRIDRRYIDYARANASIGINGVVLNNVNADPKILSAEYLRKVAALADVFRPYGIRVYLSVRFSSPVESGGLKTADPSNPDVHAWWRRKADDVYRLIPDFGGFLVKANSEGQPGPRDYGRGHADGANVIADAVRPHGGTVIWRAFVYGNSTQDRAMQAHDQFRSLDGKFASNVVLQVKNGPIDFQPREPFHPLFGQMPHTRVALEAQITREYLGQNTGVAYLAPMWSEALDADTCSPRCRTPVSSTIVAMAGVSNVGSDRNWTGTDFDQANWYAFGRLAWDAQLPPDQIAEEWTRMTWSNDPRAVRSIVAMMMRSREAAVNFMTPLGLAHQMATDYHYGPAPWVCDLKQPSWNPCYYSRADADGIGFDRTATGSNAVAQYAPPVARRFSDLRRVGDKYLLWFHHLPWTYRMRSGRRLWAELVMHYDEGVADAAQMNRTWATVRPYVDAERWQAVASDLSREEEEARWWRDASIAYFQGLSKLPLPKGSAEPAYPLARYEALRPPNLPGQRP
ncbi:MAG: alpha-glucuronidase family glycosyl hydrolase [Sphingomicrobium sp.]